MGLPMTRYGTCIMAAIVPWMVACGGETGAPVGEDAAAGEVAADTRDSAAKVEPADILDVDAGKPADLQRGEVDIPGDVCLPNCDGKECGDDGCGGSCGECDDGNICTGVENCIGSLCSEGDSLVCEDDDQCTEDSCDPDAGCIFTNTESACDDGDECTKGDLCQDGVCTGASPWPAVMFLLDTSGSMESSVRENDVE